MKNNVDNIDDNGIKVLFNSTSRPIITIDLEKYRSLLDDPALSEAEKDQFLQALWSIVVTFVEIGFGVHPLQEVTRPQSGSFLGQAVDAFARAGVKNLEAIEICKDADLSGGPEME